MIIFSNLIGSSEGSSAILFRYHCCLTDGISLLQMFLTEAQNNSELIDTDVLLRSSCSSSESADGIEETLRTEMVNETPIVMVSSEQEMAMHPSVLSKKVPKHCGFKSSRTASYWRLICTKKDEPNPLRNKKYVDAPRERCVESRTMDVKIDELGALSEHDLTLNDAILGSLFFSIYSFLTPLLQQKKAKSLHVFKVCSLAIRRVCCG